MRRCETERISRHRRVAPRARSRAATVSGAILLLLLCMDCTDALAQSLGQEWVALTAHESRIQFDATGLEGRVVRRMRTTDPGHAFSTELAVWTSTLAAYPLTMILLYELSPDRYLKRVDPPRKFVQGIDAFRKTEVRFRERSTVVNSLGRAAVQLFDVDDFRCAAFVQSTSTELRDDPGGMVIQGFHCADPKSPMSDLELANAVKGLKIRPWQ